MYDGIDSDGCVGIHCRGNAKSVENNGTGQCKKNIKTMLHVSVTGPGQTRASVSLQEEHHKRPSNFRLLRGNRLRHFEVGPTKRCTLCRNPSFSNLLQLAEQNGPDVLLGLHGPQRLPHTILYL